MRKKCIKCNITANFNVKGKSGLYCIYEGCNTRPYYNFAEEKRGIYCNKHRLVDMINVNKKTCIYEGCSTQPSYNFAGKKGGIYCLTHKLDDMIDVINKTCIYEGCSTKPYYNFAGEKCGIYCNKHRHIDMIDVINKTCIYEGCGTQSYYNFAEKKGGIYCNKHKLDNMIKVNKKTCIYEGCSTTPSYNFAGKKGGIYCNKHKLDNMINVISKTCKSDWCQTIPRDKKYDGYCLFCYINLFPDKPISRNYKTKEYSVAEFVKTKFPELDFVADKIISGGCSRRRPDLLLDMLYQIIIIEIDENQHQDYDCSCQNKRLMELSQDLGHRPIVFIRFNPDDYKKDGKNITSCWGQNKNGICVVKKSKQKEWLERLNTLEEQIKYWTCPENMTDKTIETIHLYYDTLNFEESKYIFLDKLEYV
jgi:hypothetical protein